MLFCGASAVAARLFTDAQEAGKALENMPE